MQDSDKKAEDKILEKVAEEAGEVLIASKNDENLVYESVDLIFHTLLLLVYKGVEIDELFEEFERIDSTCKTAGYVTYSCTCGESYTEDLELADHTEEIIPAIPGELREPG